MKTIEFIIGDRKYKFYGKYGNCRDGFNHFADLEINGVPVASAKVHYINRTWESYDYQTVMMNAMDVLIAEEQSNILFAEGQNTGRRRWKKEEKELLFSKSALLAEYSLVKQKLRDYKESSGFGTLAGIMALGNILCKDEKESNDWKLRMMQAGTPQGALIMPEDWDQLPEEEKARRLNGCIEVMK